jgi:hypothetical protein
VPCCPHKNALSRGSSETEHGRRAPARVKDLSISRRGRHFYCLWALIHWCRHELYPGFGLRLSLSRRGRWRRGRGCRAIRATNLLRDPTTPIAVTFLDILLPAFQRTKRAVKISVIIRTPKCLCEEIECNVWVPTLHGSDGFYRRKRDA